MIVTADERNAIIDVLHRVAFGFDQRKLDMVEASFAENATMSMRIADGELIGPFEGRSAIMQLMSDTLAIQEDQRRHVISNVLIDSGEGNTLSVSSYLSLLSIENNQIKVISSGIYSDEITQANGEWKLTKRHLDLDLAY
jgi:3-phenylpropionate/cinnamic acid dioxygenase small subunit